MGVQNEDTTGGSQGQTNQQGQGGSQYGNYGGQGNYGGGGGYTGINYLDPAAIAQQTQRYNRLLGTSEGNVGDAWGKTTGFYGGMLNSQGYSPEEKQAMAQTANAAADEKLAEAKNAAASHAALTGNDAGYQTGMNDAYSSAARDAGERMRENIIQFANEAERRKEIGGQGMANMYGTAQGAQLGLMGGANQNFSLGAGTNYGNQNFGIGGQFGGGQSGNWNQTQQNSQQQYGQNRRGQNADVGNGLGSLFGPNGLLGKLLGGGQGGGNKGGGGGSGPGGGGPPGGAGPIKGTHYDQNGDLRDQNGNLIDPETGDTINNPDSVDANGNHPGDPNYDPYSDPTNELYDPSWTGDGSTPGDSGYYDGNGDWVSPGDPNYDPTLDPTNGDYTGGNGDPFGNGDPYGYGDGSGDGGGDW